MIIEDNGVYGIVNKANNGVLTLDSIRRPLTDTELAEIYVKTEDDKYTDTTILTVAPWEGLATQKWNLQSEADKEIVIEAGNTWFSEPSAE